MQGITSKGRWAHGKENPRCLLCDRPYSVGLASLVRGSSRRITIMLAGVRARSANIRVINRRQEPLRPLLGIPYSRRNEEREQKDRA